MTSGGFGGGFTSGSFGDSSSGFGVGFTRLALPTGGGGGSIVATNLFMQLDAATYGGSGAWLDSTGNGNNGTISGATWSSADGGQFDFDGVNDTISIAHTSNLSLSLVEQRTIQVWVKFDVLPALNTQVPVFGKLSSNFGFDGYWGGLYSSGGEIRTVTNGARYQNIQTSTLTIAANTWYLFTFISQITTTLNSTKAYINDVEYISSQHTTITFPAETYAETNPLYLGFIGSGVSSLYLNGKIGACYFYTGGLSAADVATNFNATKSRYGL